MEDCYHVFCDCLDVQKVLVIRCLLVLPLLVLAHYDVVVVWELLQLDLTLVPIFIKIFHGEFGSLRI